MCLGGEKMILSYLKLLCLQHHGIIVYRYKHASIKERKIMPDLEQLYHEKQLWGLSTSIDLHDCEPELIRSADAIKQFVVELCDLLEVKRFGECTVVHFGEKPEIAGFSMTQLIETSLVSGHFVNETNAIYLDVFSCKFYEPQAAAGFAMKFFKAGDMSFNYTLRK